MLVGVCMCSHALLYQTRLQVVAREGEVSYRGISDCAAHIIKTEGPSALFKGKQAMCTHNDLHVRFLCSQAKPLTLSSNCLVVDNTTIRAIAANQKLLR
jgi:hypothetical protein